MRSAEDLRKRWLELIPAVIGRVGMYAASGREMQIIADRLLADLCFLDDRDADAEQERRQLQSYGKRGVPGPFEALFGSPRCQAEVASVYAEVFHRLGYLAIDHPVNPQRWQELTGRLREWFEDRDVRRSQAEQLLGPPSLVADRRVLCYAAANPALGWLFIDAYAEDVRRYDAGHGRYTADYDTDPLIRSVRRSGPDFEAGLILTLYGKALRWGPGWWIDHPGANGSAERQAIASQLRDINAADPSQALRSRRNTGTDSD
jgi:hypothetical protein